jgi:uncharacterized protein (TIGR03435 family)
MNQGRVVAMKLCSAGITIVVLPMIIAVLNGSASNAQSIPDDPPRFEVASIKRDVSVQAGPQYRIFPGLSVQRATLKYLITLAYQVDDFRVSGGPGWINSDRYNIEAKAEAPLAYSVEYRTLQYRRLQTLLQERFQLALHRETRELPVYDLTVAKDGPKLQSPNCIQSEPGDPAIAPGKTMMDYCGFGQLGRNLYQASSGSMTELARVLSLRLGRDIFDRTRITGKFRIQLRFAPEPSTGLSDALPADGRGSPAATADFGPDIFTALQEQLGLKLESSKGPVDLLIIDHVERPSEN